MPVITCLPGAWPLFSEYNNAVESDHDYPAITQPPKAQVNVEVKHLIDQSVQTEALEELTILHVKQELEQQDDSGSRQKSSSNQPSKNQSSRQNKTSRNEKGYESGSSEGDDEQTNDNNGDDDDDDHDDRRRRGYEASDETSNDDDDEEEEYTDDDENEPTPSPPTSRKRKTRAEEESRRYKTLKRRRGEQRQEDNDESEPMKKRSRPEKSIIHEYYREIGRSGKDEFKMEDLFDEYEIKVIHDFLSEIGKMRSRRREPSQKREGNGRRTSGKQKSSRSGGRLERKHSDIYDSFSKQDQALIHNYYQQIGHKGGKYRGSDVDEDELDEEDRKVHPGFLKEKRKRQQSVVHEFLSKVAKQKRWGQAPTTSGGTSGKQHSTGGQKRDKTGKMRSGGGGGPREM